ncbi:cation-translocating P-type ATPase [Solirubrobacter phytolaccae]|uniref:Cation-translocating P-type ATPase n=1 Tax=Solirubrobacter phytolaccae TaxID=1404360 RepID=A0A9X3NEU2_9ACTN|nr:cation-translocating P-type ATPase [Solirubrobacter phytolaccae]MDA0184014.1 cation-translocating P-type ATPase [Solirubrobacter phytolaccae]
MNPIELPMAPPPAPPEPTPPAGTRRFRVEGMDCGACAKTVEEAVAGLDGVASAQVSFGNGTMAVAGDATDELIATAVARAGYRAHPAIRKAAEPQAPYWRRDARALSTTVSIALLLVAVVASLASAPRAVAEPLYLLSMAVGGWPIGRAAVVALRRQRLDMNVLMGLAAVGAVGIGEYAEGAWVLVLFAVGTSLEAMALERSRRTVASLMDLAPARARVDGQLVDVETVTAGTVITIRPGERIPLDAVVESGASSVDQAPITGESVPVDKQPGDELFAGTLNTTGVLVARTTRAAEDSTLSRVAALVEEAQGSRAPAERFIDRFAAIYTPLVFGIALALATVPLLFGGDAGTWLYRALALLIVACPCSLVISVPVAVVSAVGGAARRGILIKGGQALEDLGRVRAVALDKTGTLTLGLPVLRQVVATDEDRALALVAAVEADSEHPLAAALRRAARDRGLAVPRAERFVSLPGRGATATVEGRELWAGGPRLMRERLGSVPPELPGQTMIALGEGDRLIARFGLADQPRAEADGLAQTLHAAGVRRVVMLTGDTEPVARAVAERAGIDEVRAGLLPADKLSYVQALEREVGAVAMVGDGVNDAPALAAARVGIAMGAAGSDVALANADVALMSDRLSGLPEAVLLARRALRIMRANVIASLAIKAVFVLLAPFGLVTLVVAIAADMGMSLLVTFNAMRLLRAA